MATIGQILKEKEEIAAEKAKTATSKKTVSKKAPRTAIKKGGKMQKIKVPKKKRDTLVSRHSIPANLLELLGIIQIGDCRINFSHKVTLIGYALQLMAARKSSIRAEKIAKQAITSLKGLKIISFEKEGDYQHAVRISGGDYSRTCYVPTIKFIKLRGAAEQWEEFLNNYLDIFATENGGEASCDEHKTWWGDLRNGISSTDRGLLALCIADAKPNNFTARHAVAEKIRKVKPEYRPELYTSFLNYIAIMKKAERNQPVQCEKPYFHMNVRLNSKGVYDLAKKMGLKVLQPLTFAQHKAINQLMEVTKKVEPKQLYMTPAEKKGKHFYSLPKTVEFIQNREAGETVILMKIQAVRNQFNGAVTHRLHIIISDKANDALIQERMSEGYTKTTKLVLEHLTGVSFGGVRIHDNGDCFSISFGIFTNKKKGNQAVKNLKDKEKNLIFPES